MDFERYVFDLEYFLIELVGLPDQCDNNKYIHMHVSNDLPLRVVCAMRQTSNDLT